MRGGLRTCTDCSSNGFGDKLAHRVEIQTPQPRLRTGLQEAQRQPSANWARTQLAGIDTHPGKPDQLLHSTTGLSTQGRSVTHQLPGTIDCRNNRCTLHWASFGLGSKASRLDSTVLPGAISTYLQLLPPLLILGSPAYEVNDISKTKSATDTSSDAPMCICKSDWVVRSHLIRPPPWHRTKCRCPEAAPQLGQSRVKGTVSAT